MALKYSKFNKEAKQTVAIMPLKYSKFNKEAKQTVAIMALKYSKRKEVKVVEFQLCSSVSVSVP